MPENLIKKIRTSQGDLQIDYNALANLPDLSSVGAQADWNETDPNSSSFIKNKTHYTAANGTVYRLDSKYMPLGVVTNVAVSNITGGHRLTLTTNNGTRTIDIMDGTIGKDGIQGEDGQDGITPHIGENGNWWLGETDTGVSASGLQANANWDQEDSEAVDFIKNKPAITKSSIKLFDTENGFQYLIKMVNGNLVSSVAPGSIVITTKPDKLVYMQGQRFDPEGMVVCVVGEDGSTSEITDYTWSEEPFMELGSEIRAYVYYFDREEGINCSAFVPVEVVAFDPATELIDFNYTANADGTYTLTGWKGTTAGVTGTELIVPDNALVIL